MDPVSETTQLAVQQQDFKTGSPSTEDVTKDEFLKLLVAQLKNQDPMNPVDNQQFLAQLATFSSLEQLISINSGVAELTGALNNTPSVIADENE